jgi:hypothetical protein
MIVVVPSYIFVLRCSLHCKASKAAASGGRNSVTIVKAAVRRSSTVLVAQPVI